MSKGYKKLTAGDFKPYGWIIECPGKKPQDKTKSHFSIILKEKAKKGWRIAYLLLREKSVRYLEQHPDSFESFEPLSGKALLYVARRHDLKDVKCFSLDKPVILKKRIWHGVLAWSGESEIKITENAEVKSKYWHLGQELVP
jgi:ureidoglycolate hydrolase